MNYLEQLFFEDRAYKDFEIEVDSTKLKGKIGTLTYEEQLEVDRIAASLINPSESVIVHTYILETLSRTLKELANKKFFNYEECKTYLLKRPAILVEKLGRIQGEFEKEIQELFKTEEIDKTFSKTPSTSEESKQ